MFFENLNEIHPELWKFSEFLILKAFLDQGHVPGQYQNWIISRWSRIRRIRNLSEIRLELFELFWKHTNAQTNADENITLVGGKNTGNLIK